MFLPVAELEHLALDHRDSPSDDGGGEGYGGGDQGAVPEVQEAQEAGGQALGEVLLQPSSSIGTTQHAGHQPFSPACAREQTQNQGWQQEKPIYRSLQFTSV